MNIFIKNTNRIQDSKLGNEDGVIALLITVVVMSIGIVLVISMIFIFLNRLEAARNIEMSAKAYFASEAGIEDALFRELNPAIAVGTSPYVLVVGDANTTIIRSQTFPSVTLDSNGNANDRERTLQVMIGINISGTSFSYAAQIGVRGLTMSSNSSVKGNVYSNENVVGANNTEIIGDVYTVGTISFPNPDITGTRNEGVDPVPLPPFDEAGWAEKANINNDPIIGDFTVGRGSSTLGPRKIEGNLILNTNSRLTVTGPIHITGDFIIKSNAEISLDESFESEGTVVFAEGSMLFSSNSEVHGTNADPKGYLMFASMAFGTNAIQLNSNSGLEGVIYAVNGDIVVNSSGEVTAVMGNGIVLGTNAEIEFDLGLITYTFSTGQTGSYGIIKWEEQ